MTRLQQATIRDFSGGWNVSDDEYNLSSKYQPVSDNIVIGVDNTAAVRYGYKRIYDFKDGTVAAAVGPIAYTFEYTSGSPRVIIPITGHAFVDGDHITISGAVTAAGIPVADLNGLFGVRKIDADNIEIQVRTPANATTTSSQTITWVRDNHKIAGTIKEQFFFQNLLHVIDDIGEICTYDLDTGTVTRIWDISKANALTGTPVGWRRVSQQYSHDTFKQTLLMVNGKNNDKPIEINHMRSAGAIVQYLVDPATVSNTNVYAADYIKSFGGYVILVNPNNTTTSSSNSPTVIDISAEGTSGVFVGNAAPDDAVQVDLGIVTNTVDPRITGIGNIRDNIFISFYDTAMLGQLGVYNGSTHNPVFKDQVPQHGALNNRVIHTIGNDLFMCDYAGVPAFSQSVQSGAIIPERLSMFIDPILNEHLSRLSQDTLSQDVWAMFNIRDRQYMLFVPKHDSASEFDGEDNPFYTTAALNAENKVIVYARSHKVMEGDSVVVTGAVDMTGLTAANINGTRLVSWIIDENYFVMEVGTTPSNAGIQGGGTSVSFAPVNDETLVYVYQYNPQLRIRRWTRFRGLNFDCGCLTNNGRVLAAKDQTVYQMGTNDQPIHGDELDVYDSLWANSTAYAVGNRVKQSATDSFIYECIVAHTSDASASYADDVIASNNWRVYKGKEISFTMETPWSDMQDRDTMKIVKQIRLDAKGRGQFTFRGYTDSYRVNREAYELVSAAEARFVGQDSGGFGAGSQPFGGGRNTRNQLAFSFPMRGKLLKFRIDGSTFEPLNIIGFTLLYNKGSIYR